MTRAHRNIALDRIGGLSPRNVRAEVDAVDVADLMASIDALGLLQPLVVERLGDSEEWQVIEGGRRWIALRQLAAAGKLAMDAPIDVVEVDVDTTEAREISLAANVVRRPLHPVEEFEAFARLVGDGLTAEQVAADFGASVRFVRQRLTLDRLSPRVRELWRSGKINAELAGAFTKGDHAAQDAYLDDVAANKAWLGAYQISQRFESGSLRADDPLALYLGLDVYQAAGGRIDDNLFEDWSLCLDGALLTRLAREKMMLQGEAIRERTGFGAVHIKAEIKDAYTWGRLPVQYTVEDRAEIKRIEELEEKVGDEDFADADAHDARIDEFEAMRQAVDRRAIERGSTADQRADAAIFLRLTRKGVLDPEFGRIPPKDAKASRSSSRASTAGPGEIETAKPEPDKPPTKAATACLDEARTTAFATLIADRPWLALMLATAALRVMMGMTSPLRIATRGRNGEIMDANATSWKEAIAELRGLTDRGVLFDLFARTIGQAIVVDPGPGQGYGRAADLDIDIMAEILATAAGPAFAPALCAAFDYEAYFKASPRATAIAAIEDAGGDANAARKLKATEAAAMAAELCKDKAWLPKPLRTPTLAGTHPLAVLDEPLVDAMATAIAADMTAPEIVDRFVNAACRLDETATIKAADLYAHFRAWLESLGSAEATRLEIKVPSAKAFALAAKDAGLSRKTTSGVHHYVGIAIPRPADAVTIVESTVSEWLSWAVVEQRGEFIHAGELYRAFLDDHPDAFVTIGAAEHLAAVMQALGFGMTGDFLFPGLRLAYALGRPQAAE